MSLCQFAGPVSVYYATVFVAGPVSVYYVTVFVTGPVFVARPD